MRDHRNLRAFKLADELATEVYDVTREFPKSERYILTAQLKRAALSVPGNIVEGCGRNSTADLFRFLDYSFGSLRETGYYLRLSKQLGLLTPQRAKSILNLHARTSRTLSAYMREVKTWKKRPTERR